MLMRSFRTALWISVLVFLPYYVGLHSELAFRLVDNFDSVIYGLLGVNVIVSWLLRSARDSIIYRYLGCPVRYGDVFVLNNQQLIINYLPMKLGTVHLATYLRNEFNFSYTSFAGAFFLQHVLISIVAAVSSFVAVAQFSGPDDRVSILLLVLFAILTALLVSVLLFEVRMSWLPDSVNRRLMTAHTQIREFSRSARQFGSSLAISVGMYLLLVLRIYLLCLIFQFDVSWGAVVVFAGVSQLSLFLAITPGALGVREFFMGALTSLFGFSAATGVILSLAERLVVLALSLVLFIFVASARQIRAVSIGHGSNK